MAVATSSAAQKAQWRRALRAFRRSLTARQANRAALAIAARITHLPAWQRARHIGLYWPADGEVDTQALMLNAWHSGKQIYLPALQPPPGAIGPNRTRIDGVLHWRRWTPYVAMRQGLFDLPEPLRQATSIRPLNRLDMLLVPLVGFDAQGHRLGMGGGFYDRTLAGRGRFRRPSIIGIAHAGQQVSALPHDWWDYPLDACITDRAIQTW